MVTFSFISPHSFSRCFSQSEITRLVGHHIILSENLSFPHSYILYMELHISLYIHLSHSYTAIHLYTHICFHMNTHLSFTCISFLHHFSIQCHLFVSTQCILHTFSTHSPYSYIPSHFYLHLPFSTHTLTHALHSSLLSSSIHS